MVLLGGSWWPNRRRHPLPSGGCSGPEDAGSGVYPDRLMLMLGAVIGPDRDKNGQGADIVHGGCKHPACGWLLVPPPGRRSEVDVHVPSERPRIGASRTGSMAGARLPRWDRAAPQNVLSRVI
jgi:hypothetical protein